VELATSIFVFALYFFTGGVFIVPRLIQQRIQRIQRMTPSTIIPMTFTSSSKPDDNNNNKNNNNNNKVQHNQNNPNQSQEQTQGKKVLSVESMQTAEGVILVLFIIETILWMIRSIVGNVNLDYSFAFVDCIGIVAHFTVLKFSLATPLSSGKYPQHQQHQQDQQLQMDSPQVPDFQNTEEKEKAVLEKKEKEEYDPEMEMIKSSGPGKLVVTHHQEELHPRSPSQPKPKPKPDRARRREQHILNASADNANNNNNNNSTRRQRKASQSTDSTSELYDLSESRNENGEEQEEGGDEGYDGEGDKTKGLRHVEGTYVFHN